MESEVHLGPEVVVPDLAGWRKERLTELPDDDWIVLSPDWVCEVLSPSTAQTDRSIKLPLYAAEGVPHCWLIDPALKTLEAYELTDRKWTLLATLKEDDSVRLPPFDAVAFPHPFPWARCRSENPHWGWTKPLRQAKETGLPGIGGHFVRR